MTSRYFSEPGLPYLVIGGIILLVLFSFAFSGVQSASAADDQIAILFTHDVHSHVEPSEYTQEGVTQLLGGYARIKTLIDREKNSYANTLVLDAGDFSMGSLFQSVYSQEALELRLMGLMGFQFTTLGNHEFDYRAEGLDGMLQAAKKSGDPLPEIIQSSIIWEKSSGSYTPALRQTFEDFGIKEYAIVSIGKYRAAIIGLMGKDADNFAPTSGLHFEPIVQAAKRAIETIKANEQVDLIIALSHSGTSSGDHSEDEELASEVPELDVIVSGHSHTLLEQPIKNGKTLIVSAGENGKYLGELVLQRNPEGHGWNVASYQLIPVAKDVQEDPDMIEKIAEYKETLNTFVQRFGFDRYDQVIAENPYLFDTVPELYDAIEDRPLGNLIADAYVYEVQKAEGDQYDPVDVAVVPVGIIRASLNKGRLTVSDAYSVLSLGIGDDGISGYPLVSVFLTGEELETVAEIDASIGTMMEGSRLYWAGMSAVSNPNRLFLNRVTDVVLTDKNGEKSALEKDALYRVIVGLYSGQMLGSVQSLSGGLLKLQPKDRDGNPIDDINQLIIHDKNGREIKEWFAFADYLQSFEKNAEGISTVPARYAAGEGRKVYVDDDSLIELVKEPNWITLVIAAIGLFLLSFLIVLTKFIVRRCNRRIKSK